MKQRSGNLHPFKNKIFTCEDLCLCTDMQMKKRFSLESSTGMENFMERNLNWAVLGTGVIANEMAQALNTMGKNSMQWETVLMKRQLNLRKNIR